MKRYDLLTFGESMIRLSTRDYERLEQAQVLDFKHGGTEANVAVALARLGLRTAWVSRLANNVLGRRVADDLQAHGVDTSHVVWTDVGRIGVFFLEVGTTPRASTVIYDRRESSMSQMQTSDFPWDLLPQAGWLHLTGITAALSESCRALVTAALLRAHEHGLTVSFDVNYRARLWTPQQAIEALEPLCRETDVLIVKQADAALLFAGAGDAETTVRNLAEHFASQAVVLTCGAAGALALDKVRNELTLAPAFPVVHTVDRIGAGDAFDAGFIAGYMQGGCMRGLQLGNAMAALKMTIPGDMALISRDEVERLVADGATGINR